MEIILTPNSSIKIKYNIIFWLILVVISFAYYFNSIIPIAIIVGAICFILFYLIFLKYPFVWIYLMILATSLGDYSTVGDGITLFHITWFMGIVAIIFNYLFTHTNILKFYSPINKYVFLYLGISAISLIYSPNVESGVFFLVITFALFIFYLMILNLMIKKNHFKILVYSIVIADIIIALFTFYQIMFQNVLFFGRQAVESGSGDKIWRASGTYGDPNVTASFLFVGLILTVAVLLYSKEKFLSKTFLIVGLLIPLAGIILTFSRSGWISLTVGIITLLFFQKSKKKIFYSFALFFIVLLVLILFTPYSGYITNRFLSMFDIIKDPSIHVRIQMAESGWQMFLQSPIWGLGYRSYPIYYDYFRQSEVPQIVLNVKESHTLFITLLAETGVIGLTMVFLWFKRFFIDSFRFNKRSR